MDSYDWYEVDEGYRLIFLFRLANMVLVFARLFILLEGDSRCLVYPIWLLFARVCLTPGALLDIFLMILAQRIRTGRVWLIERPNWLQNRLLNSPLIQVELFH